MGNREVKSDIRSVARSLKGCGRLLALVITEQVLSKNIQNQLWLAPWWSNSSALSSIAKPSRNGNVLDRLVEYNE